MPKSHPNLPQLFSNAYKWLCKSRKNHPPDSDVWDLRRTWHSQAAATMELFRTGKYRFEVQSKITLSCGETIALWSSKDALIIKVLTAILEEKLKPFLLKIRGFLSPLSFHSINFFQTDRFIFNELPCCFSPSAPMPYVVVIIPLTHKAVFPILPS